MVETARFLFLSHHQEAVTVTTKAAASFEIVNREFEREEEDVLTRWDGHKLCLEGIVTKTAGDRGCEESQASKWT